MKDKTKDIINSIFTKTMFSISLLTLIFLFCLNLCPMVLVGAFHLVGSGISGEGGGDCDDSSCTGFDVCQNAEGTGYDNSETPTEYVASGGEINEDDTTAPVLRGTQQIKILGASSAYSELSFPGATSYFEARSTLWLHFRIKFGDATPTENRTFLHILDDTGTSVGKIDLRTTGAIRYYAGTAYDTSAETGLFADNTKKHVWVNLVNGTGADSIINIYLSDNGTRPATPTYSKTNGNQTLDARKYILMEYNGTAAGIYVDQIISRATEIGDVCD